MTPINTGRKWANRLKALNPPPDVPHAANEGQRYEVARTPSPDRRAQEVTREPRVDPTHARGPGHEGGVVLDGALDQDQHDVDDEAG